MGGYAVAEVVVVVDASEDVEAVFVDCGGVQVALVGDAGRFFGLEGQRSPVELADQVAIVPNPESRPHRLL